MAEFRALTTTARWMLLRAYESPRSPTIRSLANEPGIRPMSVLQLAEAAHELARHGLAVRHGEHIHLTALGADLAATFAD